MTEFAAASSDHASHLATASFADLWNVALSSWELPIGADGSTTPQIVAVMLQRFVAVTCRDGDAGRVAFMLLDEPTHAVQQVVVRRGWPSWRDLLIPVELIASIEPEHIRLNIDRSELDNFPEYRPDEVIEADIRQALYDARTYTTGEDYLTIQISVRDGIVVLRGNVHDERRKLQATALARRVRGVHAVRNELIADDTLRLQIEAAFQQSPQLDVADLRVDLSLGMARLHGVVTSLKQRATAALIARQVKGVRIVNNALRLAALDTE